MNESVEFSGIRCVRLGGVLVYDCFIKYGCVKGIFI